MGIPWMGQIVIAQVARYRHRAFAVIGSVVLTAVAFSLLTASVATSELRVRGTVTENYRNAYDILVRPPSTRTDLERNRQLVQQNFLSGIFGGISMRQYRKIRRMPGVEVAAPIAMVGYLLPNMNVLFPMNDLVGPETRQLFRVRYGWRTDRGLSQVPSETNYLYVTRKPIDYHDGQRPPTQLDPVTGTPVSVCATFQDQVPVQRSAFDTRARTELSCVSTITPQPRPEYFPHGRFGGVHLYPFPVLLAAVDPVQEARLVGLDEAIVSGRYLQSGESPDVVTVQPGNPNSLKVRRVPVLMADRALSDQALEVTIERLEPGARQQIPHRLTSDRALKWLGKLPGKVVEKHRVTNAELYPEILHRYHRRIYQAQVQYWTPGPVAYREAHDGALQPTPVHNDRFVWRDPRLGFFAPAPSGDVQFRKLEVHVGSNEIVGNLSQSPKVRAVGTFNPYGIRGFSELSEVPLAAYRPSAAEPADLRTRKLLRGRPLLPNSNLAGYLQQPPLMLTTLSSLPAFTDPAAFTNTDPTRPLSVIRVRVAGVSGPDSRSRARVRVLAERIQRETGLIVDVTIGSSPTKQVIKLPGGKFGRPDLALSEGWVHKGVTVALLRAVDNKSLVLSSLVLAVCLLFVVNATLAAVRSRRRELGILSCVGWTPARIFSLVEVELLILGLISGTLGTGIATVLVAFFSLQVGLFQLVMITPVAALLTALGGTVPAWRACRATPVEATRRPGRPSRTHHRVRTISGLAVVGVVRLPGRTILGMSCLAIGVAALTALVAIQSAFHGAVVGTRLGDFIAVQVREVDYLAAAVTIVLGAVSVADIAYLNITERVDEIGTLQASGWANRHLRRLFVTESLLTASGGAGLGAACGIAATIAIFPVSVTTGLTAGMVSVGAGILTSLGAILLPVSRIAQIQPAHALAFE